MFCFSGYRHQWHNMIKQGALFRCVCWFWFDGVFFKQLSVFTLFCKEGGETVD